VTIEADRLMVERLGRAVLRGVSVRIADGERVSVIGPNGAGKSTLMASLAGLLPIAGGSVRMNGTAIHRFKRRDIARQLAYVPQIHDGYMGFRVRDVVEAGRYAYLEPLAALGRQDREAVDEAVAACRIGNLMERCVATLSGGERQKAWIAAALAQQTQMLFLDEPTNALDPAHQVDLIRIMRDFAGAGRTLLVICHDLNLALALGGRVVALRSGSVFFDESADVLRDTGRLSELFGTSFDLHRGSDGRSVSIQFRLEGL